MKNLSMGQSGKAKAAFIAWLLGAPLSIVIIVLLLKGC